MLKRRIVLGTYDTADNGWTLSKCQLSAAEQKTNYVEKSGGDGSWDLSTALSDGLPRYKDRTLTATLECSEGDRQSREAKIRQMVNLLDGMRMDIKLPDDELHHINGRIHIARDYSDLAHAAVTVTATCQPWKFADEETVVTISGTGEEQVVELINSGRRAVVPVLTATASGRLTYGAASFTISKGTYQWPELLLTPGEHEVTYKGLGSLTISYREAVLE